MASIRRGPLAFAFASLVVGMALGRVMPAKWFGGNEGPRLRRGTVSDDGRTPLADFTGLVDQVIGGVVQILTERSGDAEWSPSTAGDGPRGSDAARSDGARGDSPRSDAARSGEAVARGGAPETPGTMERTQRVAAQDRAQGDVVRATGFLVHEAGYVVTNDHSIQGYKRIRVGLADHRQLDAEILVEDRVADIALLRLKRPVEGLKALSIGDSDRVRPGQWVVVVGNPFDYALSVQNGIVSHVGRHILDPQAPFTNRYIQFTAPVYPGNSGGPLFDLAGNVIGVITRSSTQAQGISFAIPSNVLKRVLDNFRAGGRSDRGWVGLNFRPVHRDRAAGLAQGSEVVEVIGTVRNSPAETAGLRSGDLVLQFNGDAVMDAQDLYDRITSSAPGGEVALGLLRHEHGRPVHEQIRMRVGSACGLLPTASRVN